MNIYVGNLPYAVGDDELRALFEQFGQINSAEVIIDRRSNRSRGYGFVEMGDEDGNEAIDTLNGSDFEGRTLRVDESQPKSEKASNNRSRRKPRRQSGPQRGQPKTEPSGIRGFFKKLFG